MNLRITYLWALPLLACMPLTATIAEEPSKPIPFIFDTDMGNDVDDALALAMIHSLQSRGECELLAVTITKDHESCAAFIDAVNTFYGRGNIPIGAVRDGVAQNPGRFNKVARTLENGKLIYPHNLRTGAKAPEAVGLLRKTLAAAEDGSVVVAQVGFSTNLARLLQSEGDEISPLTGKELVKQKVRVLSIMAGAFEPIKGKIHHEYNIVKDIPSCQHLVAEWPTEVVFSGFEIGIAVPYPSESILKDYNYVEHHPIPDAYIAYIPPPHNRPTWDLTSVLYGVYPDRGYFNLSPRGYVEVDDEGVTTFEPDEKGNHRYLILDEMQKVRVTEALVQLSSQPPQKRPAPLKKSNEG
ncbi:Inosine-uridine preferring nucleoside hydrolase [Planctomycetales bacterium 10988]|nr:Inosine-uridine preferring nucleoside hydrolase [Planctomycetales bacterium 10988]